MSNERTYRRIDIAGSAAYLIWGLLHLVAAWNVALLARAQPSGLVQGRLLQAAWNLALFAGAALVFAVLHMRRPKALTYWANALVVSATDVGFILFVLLPGHAALWPGLVAPLFWVLGWLLTSARYMRPYEGLHGVRPDA